MLCRKAYGIVRIVSFGDELEFTLVAVSLAVLS